MDAKLTLEQFQDHLAPTLDTYEQAIYLYLLRHSRLLGLEEIVVGFKSARRAMAFGIGEKGKSMAEKTCYEKLRSLQSKGCVEILASENDGTRLRLRLPDEIPNLIKGPAALLQVPLEEMDFFLVPENRLAILRREQNRCFYCLRSVDQANSVMEHVSSRPAGDNGYRNIVAACRGCNNQKGATAADDFLRTLYRGGVLSSDDLAVRVRALEDLRAGQLKPALDSPSAVSPIAV